jgi:hypothetical protein
MRRERREQQFRQPLFLVRLASLLVPARYRQDWRREWESEIYHATLIREVPRLEALRFAFGSFHDAVWYRTNRVDRKDLIEDLIRDAGHRIESASFCLWALAGLIVAIVLLSGLLPTTRAVVMPLPYRDAGRIATVAQGGPTFATRSGVRAGWVQLWQRESKLLADAAMYAWKEESLTDPSGVHRAVVTARVSPNFFSLLGARTDASLGPDSVLLSHDFWERSGLKPDSHITLGGRTYRVAGVLERRFWFLSRDVKAWRVASAQEWPAAGAHVGVVVRLAPHVSEREAETELGSILQNAGTPVWASLVEITPLQDRVRSVFGSFGLAFSLSLVIVAGSLRLQVRHWFRPLGSIFFLSKTALLLAAVLLCGLEFTRAAAINMIGGTDLLTEPLSTWLFLMSSMGVLTWSIQDQRKRCRVCMRRLGLAAQVGCPGCLLLNWAGTELVCIEGHGMLHVPEMVSCWHETDRWTTLDDSWMELFAKRS